MAKPFEQNFTAFKREPVHYERDIYREFPVRLLSFTNDIGEAAKLLMVKWFGNKLGRALYIGSSGVTGGYVVLDAVDKGVKAYRKSKNASERDRLFVIGTETLGAGIFQFFASYLIPVKIVEYLRKKSQNIVVKHLSKNHTVRLVVPALVSIASVPIMVKPIDHAVEKIMEKTYWKGVEWARKRNFKTAQPHQHH